MRLVMGILDFVLSVFNLLLWVYVILSWVRPRANRWTELVRAIVEPVLSPVRSLLQRYLPPQLQSIDLSPIALVLLISLVRRLLWPLRYL